MVSYKLEFSCLSSSLSAAKHLFLQTELFTKEEASFQHSIRDA
jgi:hypothetical protein